MNKHTIELERKDHIKGYGIMPKLFSEHRPVDDPTQVLNKIVEWSQDKNIIIYNHIVRVEEENVSKTRFHKVELPNVPYKEIPHCDRVIYLDIYYQEK